MNEINPAVVFTNYYSAVCSALFILSLRVKTRIVKPEKLEATCPPNMCVHCACVRVCARTYTTHTHTYLQKLSLAHSSDCSVLYNPAFLVIQCTFLTTHLSQSLLQSDLMFREEDASWEEACQFVEPAHDRRGAEELLWGRRVDSSSISNPASTDSPGGLPTSQH